MGADKANADIIKGWYEKFTGDEPPLTPFVSPPQPLDVHTMITQIEVEIAAKVLKNRKANFISTLALLSTPCLLIKSTDVSRRIRPLVLLENVKSLQTENQNCSTY